MPPSVLQSVKTLLVVLSAESEEVAPGVVIDFDANNHIVGIEVEDASKLLDLSQLEVSSLPLMSFVVNREAPLLA